MENRKRIIISIIIMIIAFIGIYIIYGREKLGNSPRDIVYKFLTSKDIENKKEYIDNNIDIKNNILEDKLVDLSNNFIKDKFNYVLEQDVNWEELKEGEYARVKVFKNKENGAYEDIINIFYLKNINGVFKIDIDAMSINSENDFLNLILNGSGKKVLKVYAKIDNYNNMTLFKISNKVANGESLTEEEEKSYITKEVLDKIDKYYSVTLKDPVTNIEVQGIMEKGNKENEYAARYLSSVGFKQITVELSDINAEQINKTVKIESIKSLNWAISE